MAPRHSKRQRARERSRQARAAAQAIEREKWANGEIDRRNSRLPAHWSPWAKLLGATAVPATVVFGMAAGAAASPTVQIAACTTVKAQPGDTVAGLVYSWGLDWRNMGDVWQVAQANPAMADPNVLAVGQTVTDCPGPAPSGVGTGPGITLTPGQSLITLEDAATGHWTWPIPVWHLAQLNPGLIAPFGLPAGTVVHLLDAQPATNFAPSTYKPPVAAQIAPKPAPTPVPAPRPVPALPPATLPPDPPKIVAEPEQPAPPPVDPPTTPPPTSPTTSAPVAAVAPSGVVAAGAAPTFGAEHPSVAALGAMIHSGYAGNPDPANPAVVAHDFAQMAVDDPTLTVKGDAWLIGGFIQESGLSPAADNPREGAHGLGQWRDAYGRHCGDSADGDAQLACAATELELHYPTAQAVLSDPNATPEALDGAEKTYEGYGKAGRRGEYARGIAGQILGAQP